MPFPKYKGKSFLSERPAVTVLNPAPTSVRIHIEEMLSFLTQPITLQARRSGCPCLSFAVMSPIHDLKNSSGDEIDDLLNLYL